MKYCHVKTLYFCKESWTLDRCDLWVVDKSQGNKTISFRIRTGYVPGISMLRISKTHFAGRFQVHWGWFMLSFIKLSALGTSLWQFIIFGCRNMLPFVVPHPTNIFFSQHKNLVNISLQIWFFFLFIYLLYFFCFQDL